MNSCLVSKRIPADNRLVWLDIEAHDPRQQLTNRIKLLCLNTSFEWQSIGSDAQSHRNFFQRCITRALTDSVDSAFHLSRPRVNRSKTVCHSQTEIVVTMNADRHFAIAYHSSLNLPDQGGKFS